MKHTLLALCLVLASSAAAQVDPLAIVVARGSDGLYPIDVDRGLGQAAIMSGSLGSRPTDIVYDAKSGRVFVAQRGSIGSFPARTLDGRGSLQILASGEASSIALDPVGRRLFVAYRELDGQSAGLVNEISIANPTAPTIQQRTVPGMPDLVFVAWDALNQRVYVVEDDGRVARTGNGNTLFSQIAGNGVVNPGGILASPQGGVWITGRSPGRLARIATNDVLTSTPMAGTVSPRGLSFDPANSNRILMAIDDWRNVRSFEIPTSAFINLADTDVRPQDTVKTSNGWLLSANRLGGNGTNGNVTINVPGNPVNAFTVPVGIEPVALVAVDVPRLFAEPAGHGYCYRRTGDQSTKTFALQNTRVTRARMDLGPVTIGGANPNNYALVGANTCNAARLNWGDSCSFSVRFTASGPSNQPGFPPTLPYWPAQVGVTSVDGTATTTIGLSAYLRSSCFLLPF